MTVFCMLLWTVKKWRPASTVPVHRWQRFSNCYLSFALLWYILLYCIWYLTAHRPYMVNLAVSILKLLQLVLTASFLSTIMQIFMFLNPVYLHHVCFRVICLLPKFLFERIVWMHRNNAYFFRMAVETSRIFSAFLVVHFDEEEVVVQGVKGPKGKLSFQIHFVF